MKLQELLNNITYVSCKGDTDIEISSLVYDSRKDCKQALFVCISGSRMDSHDFIPQVIEKGAAAVVVEHPVEVPDSVCVIQVEDGRKALACLAAAWFRFPARRMTTIGLTGTKGKTTTAYMIKSILEASGKKVGVIGTNGISYGTTFYPSRNTTPESYQMQEYMAEMAEAGCDCLVTEVSSQGLKLHRVAGIEFDFGVFTNLSPDHIGPDEHKDFEEYRMCKGLLFRQCRTGIVNIDDENTEALLEGHTCKLITYGKDPQADYCLKKIAPLRYGSFMGSEFILSGRREMDLKVGIPGQYNVYNAMCAAITALEAGASPEAAAKVLETIKVNGRMELAYSCPDYSIIIDYAHNGFSAENLLKTLREYDPGRLVVVFGCGGNRDPHRRYEMGEAAGKMADLSIITADNSRWEKVEDIMKDIHIGMDKTGGTSIDIPDRREAIEYSIAHAQPGDVIAIIGKGHEDYQEVCGKRVHFLDREVVEETLKKLGRI